VRVLDKSSAVQRDFSKHRDAIRDVVQAFGDVLADSIPSRFHISLAEFLDLACAILQDVNVEETSRDSTFYRAMKKIPIVIEELDSKEPPSTPRMFGTLLESEMKYVESLFLELSRSGAESKEDGESDSKENGDDNQDGLLDIQCLLNALPETMPVHLASYLDDAETKTKINLEELYGYFDSCKREKASVIEEIMMGGNNSSCEEKKEGDQVAVTSEEKEATSGG